MKPFTKYSDWLMNYEAIKKLPQKQINFFACDVARLVLPIYEQGHPNDKIPRNTIETIELFVYGKVLKRIFTRSGRSIAKIKDNANREANVDYSCSDAANAANSVNSAYLAMANVARDAEYAADTALYAYNASSNIYDAIHTIFLQTKQTPIPITPTLKAIATNIVQTRNFEEYYVLLDNLEEFHNIQLERTVPLGLSHYVLYTLTDTN